MRDPSSQDIGDSLDPSDADRSDGLTTGGEPQPLALSETEWTAVFDDLQWLRKTHGSGGTHPENGQDSSPSRERTDPWSGRGLISEPATHQDREPDFGQLPAGSKIGDY